MATSTASSATARRRSICLAGALIAQEAGIEIRALDGGPFEESIDGGAGDRSFVAAHPKALPGLLALVS
ncbi:hypothetical protein ACFSTC_34655 [Nonomuraea ferruginea]